MEEAGLTFAQSPRFGRDASFATGLAALRTFVAANGHDRCRPTTRRPTAGSSRAGARACAGVTVPERSTRRRAALLDAGLRLTGERNYPARPKPSRRPERARTTSVRGSTASARPGRTARRPRGDPRREHRNDPLHRELAVVRPIKLVLVGRIADLIGLDRPSRCPTRWLASRRRGHHVRSLAMRCPRSNDRRLWLPSGIRGEIVTAKVTSTEIKLGTDAW